MLKRLSVVVVLAVAVAAASSAQSPQPSPPPAAKKPVAQGPPITFGVEVTYVEVDAIVTDKAGNVVRDLTKDDFEVKENGKPHDVDLMALVDLPVPAIEKQKVDAVEPDVRSNAQPFEGRLYVVVLDDLHTAALRSPSVKLAARRFLQQYLGEGDLAAVVYTSGRRDASQELTDNRRLLLTSVDKFMGRRLRSATLNKIDVYNMTRDQLQAGEKVKDPEEFERGYNARVALDTLKSVADWLGNIRGRRKAILFISEGIDYNIYDVINNTEASSILDSTRAAVTAATAANVSFYTVDPRGLHNMFDETMELTPVDDPTLGLDSTGLRNEYTLAQDSLRVLADETLGRAAVSTNDFADAFRRVVTDNSCYYMLGYRPINEKHDGRYRKIEVRVKRPGLTVRTRGGYVSPKPSKKPDVPAGPTGKTPEELRALLNRPMQQSGLTLSVNAAPFRGEGKKADVMVTVQFAGQSFRFTEKDGQFHDVVQLSVVAVDSEGKLHGNDSEVKLDLKPQTRRAVDVAGFRMISKIDLLPGRYQLRVAARAVNTGTSGSVHYDLEVPDFSNGPLAISGLAVASAAASSVPTAGAFEPLKGILPAPPTTFREFYPLDTLAVAADVYDNELKTPHTIDITTSVRSEDGVVKFHTDMERKTDELKDTVGGSFVHKALVPLKDLEPGSYTLRVEARSRLGKKASAFRDVTFTIVPAPAAKSGE